MLCPPTMRPASPAESEISVGGAPSPLPHSHPHPHSNSQSHLHPQQHHLQSQQLQRNNSNAAAFDLLQQQQQLLMQQHVAAAAAAAAAGFTRTTATTVGTAEEYFQPLKRLRMSTQQTDPSSDVMDNDEQQQQQHDPDREQQQPEGDGLCTTPTSHSPSRSPSTVTTEASTPTTPTNVTATGNAKSNVEGVKSFSIADILGHSAKRCSTSPSSPPPPPPPLPPPPPAPSSAASATASIAPGGFSAHHLSHSPASAAAITNNGNMLLQSRTAESLDMMNAAAAAAAAAAAGVPPHHAAHAAHAAHMLLPTSAAQIVRPWDHLFGPIPVRPFLPSALLHYDQRLALDYHRQLQEHFSAQAQLLRHMGVDIIPSESGSERSSSAASDCCSPEIVRSSAMDGTATGSSGHNGLVQTRHSPQTHANASATGERANSGGSSTNNGATTANNSISSGKTKPNGTPLDALFQMTTKDFDESQDKSHLDIFSNRPQPKKKRKSRTAFTNHQIFELEKRFLYQKYLSPADRDDIAASLGLSNAQVITWFQNRRAKQKRDIEELKKDFDSVKVYSAHKSFLENVNDLSILKKKPIHEADMVGLAAAAAAAAGMVPVVSLSSAGVTHTLSPQK